MGKATPLTVRAGPELDADTIELRPRRNVLGAAVGWVGTAKEMVEIDDELIEVKVRISAVAVGSQHWEEGDPSPIVADIFKRMYGVDSWPPPKQ